MEQKGHSIKDLLLENDIRKSITKLDLVFGTKINVYVNKIYIETMA